MSKTAQRKPIGVRILGGAFYGLFCALVLGVGAVAGWINSDPLVRNVVWKGISHEKPQQAWSGRDSVTLLILGCDEDRYYGGKQIIHQQARSDMILVAKLDFKNNRITGVSIPRDTLAAPDGYKRQKINAFHLLGGPELSKAAVESLIPVQIDRVVVLNYNAFQEMIDLVGGVDVVVPKKMDYDDVRGHLHIHLKPGPQHLDGEDAVGFVRFRHSDDDFHRQGRQKEFLLAFKNAVMHKPTALPQVAAKAQEVMGNSLTPDEIASLALFARSVGDSNIKMGMIPTVPARNYNLRVDNKRVGEVLTEFHMMPEAFPSTVSARR